MQQRQPTADPFSPTAGFADPSRGDLNDVASPRDGLATQTHNRSAMLPRLRVHHRLDPTVSSLGAG